METICKQTFFAGNYEAFFFYRSEDLIKKRTGLIIFLINCKLLTFNVLYLQENLLFQSIESIIYIIKERLTIAKHFWGGGGLRDSFIKTTNL